MNKKADLSINIIIVAAIALIILVVVSVLIFGSGRDLRRGTSCEGLGGICVDRYMYNSCADYASTNYMQQTLIRHPTASCQQQDTFCCVRQ